MCVVSVGKEKEEMEIDVSNTKSKNVCVFSIHVCSKQAARSKGDASVWSERREQQM